MEQSKEPAYDASRLSTDHSYRFSMIDQLTTYMNSIEPFTGRIKYYMSICKVLDLEVPTFNMGSQGIFERPYRSWNNETDSFDDEKGNRVPIKFWRISYSNDEERTLLYKLWFIEQHQTRFRKFKHWVNKSLEDRKASYFEQAVDWSPVEYAKLQLEAIESEINRFQADFILFVTKANSFESETIKNYWSEAPTLVQEELLGNNAINWLAFNRADQLQPFAFLWDMIAFKLFLIQQISNPITATHASTIPNKNPPSSVKKTGVYEKSQSAKEAIITYFWQKVREKIESAVGRSQEPQKGDILSGADKATRERYSLSERTLRGYITAKEKTKVFGEIHRQTLATRNLTIR